MGWPYHLVDLTDQEKFLRRQLLDRYGAYAQLSALLPVFIYNLYRLACWVSSERQRVKSDYTPVPGSPASKKLRSSSQAATLRRWRSTVWWLEGEVLKGWGYRGHWIAGLAWASWLLFLSVHETGIDYLHVTKRFGIVAASQFPIHYMLSMKGPYSPFALAFRASHEQLNPWHRISGRIIYLLLTLHATWYLNYFVQAGVLRLRLTSLVPLLGVVAFCLLTVLVSTSLATVRRWSYRVFFILHLTIAIGILPLLFFHARPLRLYTAESLVLFLFDITARKLDTTQSFTTLTQIPNTKLLKLTVPIPPSKISRFKYAPGQHIYLSIPPESTPYGTSLPSIYDLLHNPFTVTEVTDADVSIVLRTLHGPTTKTLRYLTKLTKAKPPINIEGPYGMAQRFPNFASTFDRILLVAGGVGATYILPIYRHIVSSAIDEGLGTTKVEFIWSMRSAAEAAWTTDTESANPYENDDRVKIYVTGVHKDDPDGSGVGQEPDDGSVEMADLTAEEHQTLLASGGSSRPNLKVIVDRTFRHSEREKVAVLVCGPAEMAEELREHVGRWVAKGRDVWWHDEAFGW